MNLITPRTRKISDRAMMKTLTQAVNAIIDKDEAMLLRLEVGMDQDVMHDRRQHTGRYILWHIQFKCLSNILSRDKDIIRDITKWELLENSRLEPSGCGPDFLTQMTKKRICTVHTAVIPERINLKRRLVYPVAKVKTGLLSTKWMVIGLPLVSVEEFVNGSGKIRPDLRACIHNEVNRYRRSNGMPEIKL